MKSLAFFCITVCFWHLPAAAQLVLEAQADGFNHPVDIADAGDGSGRLFIVEQSGIIKVLDQKRVASIFLDIGSKVRDIGGEEGLLGLVFHPDYSENGFFFVNYTRTTSGRQTVVERYTVSKNDSDLADPASGVEVISFSQPQSNHNAGDLNFGPEGNLYIAVGDGGSGNDPGERSQDLTLHLGKLLRINVDQLPYTIPGDNPYATSSGDTVKAIWASGLRNPWRFSFDDKFNLWIADVGQSDREEINFVPATENIPGLNFGWDCREGNIACPGCRNNHCQGLDFVEPVHWYGPGPGLSITGGYVLEAEVYPHHAGKYIFADFALNEMRVLDNSRENAMTLSKTSATRKISTFGKDEFGHIYAASHNGTIFRIVEKGLQQDELIAVQISHYEKAVLLEWQTQPDLSASHFEIERSKDDQEYRQIGIVPIKSNQTGQSYQFVDDTRQSGHYFYRLKTIDEVGNSNYSMTLDVKIKEIEDMVVSPNPARNKIHIHIPTDLTSGLLQVVSLSGAVLHSESVKHLNTEPIELDISAYDRGLVMIQFTNDGNRLTKKLMLY